MKACGAIFFGSIALLMCGADLRAQTAIEQTQAAEHRENLKTCLSGRYPALCKRELLSTNERAEVDAAERGENLKTCLSGRYPALCKRELLSAPDGTDSVPPRSGIDPTFAAPTAPNVAGGSTDKKPTTERPKAIHSNRDDRTNEIVKQQIINESIASYRGNCPCPYNTDRIGRRCGARSAYSRPGGASPICYVEDVTPQMVDEYRRKTAQ